MSDKLQEVIRYNGTVATRAEAAEGLLAGGVPVAWVIRYLSDSPTLTAAEFARESKPKDRKRFAARFSDEARDDHGRFAPAGNAGGVPAPKPAHEMTTEEFGATLPGRVSRKPAVSVEAWAKEQGREAALIGGSDNTIANLIGGLLTERTAHGKGKVKALAKKMGEYNALHRDYQAAVTAGAVPQVETVTPLDPDSPADAAHVRAMHKRAIYRALGAGMTVPEHVLAAYPGVADRAADKKGQ